MDVEDDSLELDDGVVLGDSLAVFVDVSPPALSLELLASEPAFAAVAGFFGFDFSRESFL